MSNPSQNPLHGPLFSDPILVTGAAGFIGSEFVRACNRRGQSVLSVDLPEHFKTRTEHLDIDYGRIISRDELLQKLGQEELKLGAIVHLGACSDTSQLNVDYLQRVNVDYSKALWDYAIRNPVPLVYASSAATYGGGELGYDDDESLVSKLVPLNPYGESKRLFDQWALEQEKAGHHPELWAGFKFFNVYGYGERHKGPNASVVLHAFDQIKRTGQAKLFKSHRAGIADGYQSRDFIYVDDVIDVLIFALQKPIERGVYNLGTGKARPFIDLVRAVFVAMKEPEMIEFIDTPLHLRERYQYFTEARMGRLREQGYFMPFTSLEEGASTYIKKLIERDRRRPN